MAASSSSSGWVNIPPPPTKPKEPKPKRGRIRVSETSIIPTATEESRFVASALTLPYPTESCTREKLAEFPPIIFLHDEIAYQVVFVDSCYRILKKKFRNLAGESPDDLSFIQLCTLILKEPKKVHETLRLPRWLAGYFDYNTSHTGCSVLIGDSSVADHMTTEELSDKINFFLKIKKNELFTLDKNLAPIVYFKEHHFKQLIAGTNLCQTCVFNMLIIFVKSFTLLSHALSFRPTLFDNISKENTRRGFNHLEAEILIGSNANGIIRQLRGGMIDRVLHRLQTAMMYHHDFYGFYCGIRMRFFDNYKVQIQKIPKGQTSNSGSLYPNLCTDMGLEASDLCSWAAIYMCLCVWQHTNRVPYAIVLYHMLPEPISVYSRVFYDIRIVRRKDNFVLFESTIDPIK